MRSRCACSWQSTCVCISAGVLHCRDLLYAAGTRQGGAVQRRSPVCVGGSARPCRLDDLLYAEQPEGVALLGRQPGVRDGLIPVLICHLCQHYLLPRQHILQIPQTLKVQIRIHPCRAMRRPSASKQWLPALQKSASCQIMDAQQPCRLTAPVSRAAAAHVIPESAARRVSRCARCIRNSHSSTRAGYHDDVVM